MTEPTAAEDRDATITQIRKDLRARSGKPWSVTGGRGTSWGWITITAPPGRRNQYGNMGAADCAELGELLSLDGPAHHQGAIIPASREYRREYLARAAGNPFVAATPYWD